MLLPLLVAYLLPALCVSVIAHPQAQEAAATPEAQEHGIGGGTVFFASLLVGFLWLPILILEASLAFNKPKGTQDHDV